MLHKSDLIDHYWESVHIRGDAFCFLTELHTGYFLNVKLRRASISLSVDIRTCLSAWPILVHIFGIWSCHYWFLTNQTETIHRLHDTCITHGDSVEIKATDNDPDADLIEVFEVRALHEPPLSWRPYLCAVPYWKYDERSGHWNPIFLFGFLFVLAVIHMFFVSIFIVVIVFQQVYLFNRLHPHQDQILFLPFNALLWALALISSALTSGFQ
ncbi:hypothetical protein PROFUN_11715 [Planoprotostelium fungivorum]|uniref:Uncharacterized protein n=1 Tax=Planoprotostelium fungivorum TaxID=1890364 RepID=A0A2P6N968_9EUKA|nr:hypothetical protein PROFUN_11715 [Planoprotostelium fungivorum]